MAKVKYGNEPHVLDALFAAIDGGFQSSSFRRVIVLVTAGVLVIIGFQLSIFHLVGLLLVVAVGSNYSLFFDQEAPSGAARRGHARRRTAALPKA